MIFNIPSEFHSVYFIKFPRIIAVILKDFMLTPMICVRLLHSETSSPLPIEFQDPLRLFGKLFKTKVSRRKRGTMDNFFLWVFGDLETIEIKHHVKINRLIDNAKSTSLSIDQNAKKLSDIMGDVRNDEIILKDLALKGDLINVFDSLHNTFLGSIARLTDYQNSHAFLLLEFEFSLKSDS